MIGYITLGTEDVKRGAAFYDAIAKELGTPRMMGSVEDGFIRGAKWATVRGCRYSNRMTVRSCPLAMAAWWRCRRLNKPTLN